MINLAHEVVIEKLRASVADGTAFIAECDDAHLLRTIFLNYRTSKGVRLTGFGCELLMRFFRSYTFTLPVEFHISPAIILWLDRESSMPYFLSQDTITVFDPSFAIRIKLAGADLTLLMEAAK